MRRGRRAAVVGPLPDFLPRSDHPPWLAWLWLGCCALALAFAVDDWLAVDASRSEVRSWLDRIPSVGRPAAASPRVTAMTDTHSARADAAARATAQDVARRLAHPWTRLFEDTARAAAPGLRWLRLEHDAERGDVRLEAAAAGREAVLATLDALAATPGWRDVMMLRLESAEGAAKPDAGLRVELRARYAPSAAARGDTP